MCISRLVQNYISWQKYCLFVLSLESILISTEYCFLLFKSFPISPTPPFLCKIWNLWFDFPAQFSLQIRLYSTLESTSYKMYKLCLSQFSFSSFGPALPFPLVLGGPWAMECIWKLNQDLIRCASISWIEVASEWVIFRQTASASTDAFGYFLSLFLVSDIWILGFNFWHIMLWLTWT